MNPREFLLGIRRYLTSIERSPGELYCVKHRIEHTGTMAYAALLDCELAANGAIGLDGRFAPRVAKRVVSRVVEDPAEKYGAWIVLPGSRDPHNHSNNAIDSGCAIDALSTLARRAGDTLPPELRGAIEGAVRQVCSTYIVPHAIPKEIVAQRLWAVAALGSAYAWLREPQWKEAGLAAIDKSLSQQNPDGSFPYTPLGTPRSHPGSADASAFYHSRHALFAAHALESFGVDVKTSSAAEHLRGASEFLLALRRADGTKTPLVEAKPWYWGSRYEVAGFPFDIASLLTCGRILSEPRYLAAAAEMYDLLTKHVELDGGITSHRGEGWNFQCRPFWNAHCAWIAREEPALIAALAARRGATGQVPDNAPDFRWFPDAGFGRYADSRIVVLVRGRKPPNNLNHGSPVGGGGLLHAASRRAPALELVQKDLRQFPMAGEWAVRVRGTPGRWERVKSAWRRNREELRFSLWIGKVRARGGDTVGALRWVADRWIRGIWTASSPYFSSGFASDVKAEFAQTHLAFRGAVADAFGDPLTGVETIRRYNFETGCVRAGDALAADRPLTDCRYRVPAGADQVSVDGPPHKVRQGVLTFGAVPAGALIAVRYRIQVP